MEQSEIQKFVLAVDAGENAKAKELLKQAMAKKVAKKLKAALQQSSKDQK